MNQPIRARARVTGVVQGVGYRPFVYALATRLGLAGFVGNDVDGVFVEAEGSPAQLDELLLALQEQAPPLAEVETVTSAGIPVTGERGFAISASESSGARNTLVAADSATCPDCLAELDDPTDPRYDYPFINCTNCGPRFTIVTGIPYDRPLTTMAGFAMCAQCASEYHDPADRRFHAQPVCCPRCGPRVQLLDSAGCDIASAPIADAAALLNDGAVLAVKGLGGYHLAAAAAQEHACATLRARKHREDKAFAVMVGSVAAAGELCDVDAAAEDLLTSRRRPIVLLPKKRNAPVADAVAPHNRELGVMLSYTPLHELLLRATAGPIVLTSGNVSDEPIAYQDSEALERLAPIADAFLTHDRPIHTRTDDSVVRPPVDGQQQEVLIRRSRGYVPEPLPVPWSWPRPVLGCGGELKNTFCLASGERAFVSHHIGDLENMQTLRSFTEGIEHFRTMFEIKPEVVAYDLHPEYLSTKHARTLSDLTAVGVQHHHAHVAACLADNRSDEQVIGVAFDGTGYGIDGTIWGGEFLHADLLDFERVGFLDPVRMPGAAAAVKHPWRMAAAHLQAAYEGAPPADLGVRLRHGADWDVITTMVAQGMNSPLTTSAGRLFDAVAAITGVRDSVNYEGQAAVELEQATDPREDDAYPVTVRDGAPLRVSTGELVCAATEDVRAGTAPGTVSARFHNALAETIVRSCEAISTRTGCGTVALSGGVFANVLLYRRTAEGLRRVGFRVLSHARVPCNDGGISFGQAAVAGARDRAGLLE